MFARSSRLPREELEALLSRGRSETGQFLSLKIQKKDTPARGAVVVSKKAAPKAVARTRLKRRLRHLLKGELSGRKGSYALIARKGASEASHEMLLEELQDLLKRFEGKTS